MLKFIGTGSAFNTKLHNNSAYISNNRSLLLLDCGSTVFNDLVSLNILHKNIYQLHILITHTHPDHIGSLGEVIFYAYYKLGIITNIVFPNVSIIINFLNIVGVKPEMYNIVSINDMQETSLMTHQGLFIARFKQVSHSNTIESYGIEIEHRQNNETHTFYYSGDSNELPTSILNKLLIDDNYHIYHDTAGLEYEGSAHLSFNKLLEIVPSNLRNRVTCMHLDEYISQLEITKSGFKSATTDSGEINMIDTDKVEEILFMCVKNFMSGTWLTKGKVYKMTNGIIAMDNGMLTTPIENSKFISDNPYTGICLIEM